MTYREKFISRCKEQSAILGRKLVFLEVVGLAEECHLGMIKERKRGAVLPEAEQVYALFPKKVGREDALKAITGALKKHPLDYLLGKTSQFAEAVNSWPSSYRYFQDGGDRCPHPATWFNAGRYADDPKEWRRHGARVAAPNQHVSPPEPQDWRRAFPDFVDKEKPWHMLQPAQQSYIIANMATAQHFSEPVEAEEQSQRLREA